MTIDNRIQFPPTRIDFENDVGETGQSHDSYPDAGQQPRYDWMRMYLIGLLAHQSSTTVPDQYREGTIWFNLNDNTLKIYSNGVWVDISDAIKLDVDSDGDPITLSAFYTSIKTLLGYKPTTSFSGSSSNNNVTTIPVPSALRSSMGSGSRAFVWVNGLMLDPRLVSYSSQSSPSSLILDSSVALMNGDTFTVISLAIDSTLFSSSSVLV